MSREVMQQAVDWALQQNTGWLSVTLFGGEPLLDARMLSTVEEVASEAILRRGVEIVPRWLLDTNATLLNDFNIEWLRTKASRKVFVSLDGAADVHDRHRLDVAGNPTHARVIAGITRLKAHNIPFDVVAVVSPDTAAHLGSSLEFLLDTGAECISFQTNLAAAWNESALAAFTSGTRAAARVWAQQFQKGNCAIVEPFHSKVLSHLLRGLRHPSRCQLATREVAVTPSGQLYPCAEMAVSNDNKELSIGNVWEGLDSSRIAELRTRTARVSTECAGCSLVDRCLNACGCRQRASSGKLGRVGAALCETEASWIDAADEAAEQLVAEGCAAFHEFYYERSWVVAAPALRVEPRLVQLRRAPR